MAVFSPHTAFDSAAEGINQRLAEGLELAEIAPLRFAGRDGRLCGCRWRRGRRPAGDAGSSLDRGRLAERLKRLLKIEDVQAVGEPDRPLHRVAVACGTAGEFLGIAAEQGCDCLVTGETRFHTCLEAEARGIALLLVGHYASERFGVEALAGVLTGQFPGVTAWASRDERDPLMWL